MNCPLSPPGQQYKAGENAGEGEDLRAVPGGEGLLQPDLHILPGDVPAVLGAQAGVRRGLTAHQDVPVLQHLPGCVLLEVDQLKQLDRVVPRKELRRDVRGTSSRWNRMK